MFAISREELIQFVYERFSVTPDFPWRKHPDYGVFRHPSNGKWFGLVLTLPRTTLGLTGTGTVTVLNVKNEPELNHLLRQQDGVFPAYHMNKTHWNSLDLTILPKESVLSMLETSFHLTH